MRGGDQSWMDERFSQGDNVSNNNLRDSSVGAGIQIRKQNVNPSNGSVGSLTNQKQKTGDQCIPERRRKYLNNASDDHSATVAQTIIGVDNTELYDSKAFNRNKKNVHLQPLDHNPTTRNSSVPPTNGQLSTPAAGAPHPLNFAPSPNVRGGNQIRL